MAINQTDYCQDKIQQKTSLCLGISEIILPTSDQKAEEEFTFQL